MGIYSKMTKNTLIFVTLTLLQLALRAISQESNCRFYDASCADCISGGADCVWCSDETFIKLDKSRRRCDSTSVMGKICTNKTSPSTKVDVPSSNKPLGPKVQVFPQKVVLTLRKGQPGRFDIKVKPAKDYPVDLYYLMDLSYSMHDDLTNLKNLGAGISRAIGTVTKNYRLAFGSFVDKRLSPYIRIDRVKPPQAVVPPFGFQHNLDFTEDAKKFADGVEKRQISGNLDFSEGGFDGLMQVTACQKRINWKANGTSRRIIVFVTDAEFHCAGDGKLGGVILPNDGQCHLDSNGFYTKSTTMDYPSVGQLRSKMKENKIVPILAVTKNTFITYQNLAEEWKDLGTTVGELSKNSDNVVNLIRDSYEKVSSTVRLVETKKEDVKVQYNPKKCRKSVTDNECTGVAIEEEVVFEVSVTAESCKDSVRKSKSFDINIAGFGAVQVETNFLCDCDCEKAPNVEVNSTKCSFAGNYSCGICSCEPGRFGSDCKCDDQSRVDDSTCKADNSTDTVCSNIGTCICGTCECFTQPNPEHKVTGSFCECKNFGCDAHNSVMCGGPDRGVCECNKCRCKGIWTGSNCGQKNCTLVAKDCVKGGEVCSGHGTCNCGECQCEPGYKGTHCELCPSCESHCTENRDCVLCEVFKRGDPAICNNCTVKIVMSNATRQARKCEFQDDDGCYISFYAGEDAFGNFTIWANPKKTCPKVIKSEPDLLAIVLGIIGGLLLAAILALLIWKLFVSTYDRFEYSKFEKDRLKSKWNKEENPIYKGAKAKYDNPAYAGKQ
eukprot:gene14150-5151_t